MFRDEMFRTYNSRLLKTSLRVRLENWVDRTTASMMRWGPWGKALWQRRMEAFERAPIQINIETTSICNARCTMCPRHTMRRTMEEMPFDLYRKIVRDAKAAGTRRFVLTGYGEIFTSRENYGFYIRHMREQIPDALIRVVTNGSLMDRGACQLMIDQEVFRVDVSIDGATATTYEAIRRNLKFAVVLANTRRLIQMKREQRARFPAIRVNLVSQDANAHEIEAFRRAWEQNADYVGDHFLLSRLGAVDNHKPPGSQTPCILPFTEVNVWSNGDVVICSDDWDGEEVMGNVKDQTLLEIWRGERFRRVRERHRSGAWGEVGACAKCSSFRRGPEWFQSHATARPIPARPASRTTSAPGCGAAANGSAAKGD